MSDKMEKFIRDNRREFDEFEPPQNLWERIEKELNAKPPVKSTSVKVVRLSSLLKVAAMLLLVAATGLIFTISRRDKAVDIAMINPELGKQQIQYASMIEIKQDELRELEKSDPYLYKEFASEIGKMESNYQKLKTDLATSPNQAETVKAMIRNLQTQIEVLNQQLMIIQQINQVKKGQTNGTQSI